MGSIHTVKEGGTITWRKHVPELAVTLPLKNSTEHNVIVIAVMLFHNTLVLSCYRPTKLGEKTAFYRGEGRQSLGVCKERWCRTTVRNMERFTHAGFVLVLYYKDFNLF